MVIYLQVITTTGTTAVISPAAVIDTAESVIWVRRYDTPGEFELYFAADKDIFGIIKAHIGHLIVTREDRQDVMYVEYAKLTESEENGDRVLLKGRSIDCVMGRRVIGYPTYIVHTPLAVAIGQLIRENMTDPEPLDALHRTIAPLTYERGSLVGTNIERRFNGENLLESVGGLLKEGGYGLRNRLTNGVITLELYKGRNRPNVKFSPGNENLLSSEYECDIRGQCNTVFVYAAGDEEHIKADGTNPYTVTRQYPVSLSQASGYARYEGSTTASSETFVTATESLTSWEVRSRNPTTDVPYSIICPTEIQSGKKVSVTWEINNGESNVKCRLLYYDAAGEEISSVTGIAKNGSTVPPVEAAYFKVVLYKGMEYMLQPSDVVSVTVTALRDRPMSEYNAAVEEQGAALMTSKTDSISGETIETGLYRLGVDYDLGDTVRVENSYGVKGTAKVDAITEVEDAEGYRIYPTFTDWTVV
jgi:hypothetical protein